MNFTVHHGPRGHASWCHPVRGLWYRTHELIGGPGPKLIFYSNSEGFGFPENVKYSTMKLREGLEIDVIPLFLLTEDCLGGLYNSIQVKKSESEFSEMTSLEGFEQHPRRIELPFQFNSPGVAP